jgi:hypothetical protein
MLTSKRNLIVIPPGVDKDDNAYTSFQWSDADKIRFYRGFPQKIGGWSNITFGNAQTLSGVPRSIWSYIDSNGLEHVLIGTDTRLYSYESGNLYNITPLVTATTAIANSLSTNYNTLANNPVTTTINTQTITLTVSSAIAGICRVGDFILVSGVAGAVGGIAAADINGTFRISTVGATSITYQSTSATAATSTATGGGAAVVLSQRVITVAQVGHGFADGDRIKILAATGFGGFAASDLNIEGIVRSITANSYAYYSTVADSSGNFATSSAAAGGGAATTVQGQIAAGTCTIKPASGYGGGTYGTGKYGIGKPFNAGFAYPRMWSFDRFGTGVVLTPGNQTGLYFWAGNVATAPVLQTAGSAPTAINYVVVENRQIIVFGAGGVPNNIRSTNDITNWVAGPTVTVFNGTIPQAGRLLSSSYCKGQVVLFANNSVYKMTFVGSPTIWVIDEIMTSDGALGPKCITSINDNVVWVGGNNFYIYNGSIAMAIPNNTLREWFYQHLNNSTSYQAFIHKSTAFNEIWFFAPFNNSEEPTDYIIWNWEEGHFTNGQLTRTASEEPANPNRTQYMATGSCDGSVPTPKLYAHEVENDYTDDGSDMPGSLTSNYSVIGEGDYMQEILRVIPSTIILPYGLTPAGNLLVSMNIFTKEYDGAIDFRTFGPYNIYDNTQKLDTRVNGRQRQYEFTFDNMVGFRLEKFFEEVRVTTPR